MKRIILLLDLFLIISLFIGCASNNTHSNSKTQKQTIEETETKLSNNIESEDEEDDYDPKYTQIWESRDKNISFKIVSKYGLEDNCRILGKFYDMDIDIGHSNWDPQGKCAGEMYFHKATKGEESIDLFSGGYDLSKNQKSLTLIIRKVYKNKFDKHGLKKGDKILFVKKSGPKAHPYETENDKADADFSYTYNSETKTLTFSGKGKIQNDLENDVWTKIFKINEPRYIIISSGISEIGDFAFFAIEEDKNIGGDPVPKNNFSKIEYVEIPDTITGIGQSAFYRCKSLKSIKLPSKIKTINENTFCLCESLYSVTMGDNIKKIDAYAFDDCKKLKKINLSNKLKVIGYKSFQNCAELSNIKIPDSTKSIAPYAFFGCEKLKEISIPKSVSKINIKAFGYANDKKKISGFTIKGYKGTAAEAYAKTNGFNFVDLGKQ